MNESSKTFFKSNELDNIIIEFKKNIKNRRYIDYVKYLKKFKENFESNIYFDLGLHRSLDDILNTNKNKDLKNNQYTGFSLSLAEAIDNQLDQLFEIYYSNDRNLTYRYLVTLENTFYEDSERLIRHFEQNLNTINVDIENRDIINLIQKIKEEIIKTKKIISNYISKIIEFYEKNNLDTTKYSNSVKKLIFKLIKMCNRPNKPIPVQKNHFINMINELFDGGYAPKVDGNTIKFYFNNQEIIKDYKKDKFMIGEFIQKIKNNNNASFEIKTPETDETYILI